MERLNLEGYEVIYGGGRGLSTVLEARARFIERENLVAVTTSSDEGGDSRRWIHLFIAQMGVGDIRKASGPLCQNPYFNELKEHRFTKGSGPLNGLTVNDILMKAAPDVFKEFGIIDPLEKILAVKRDDPDLEKLLNYKFLNGDQQLDGACVGNVILAALNALTGDVNKAIDIYQRLFGIKGLLAPVSLQAGKLVANIVKKNDPTYYETIEGEDHIDTMHEKPDYEESMRIDHFKHKNGIPLNPRVRSALLGAKRIIVAAGSPYTSILATSLTEEFDFYAGKSDAEGVIIGNIMRNHGEGFQFINQSEYLENFKHYNPTFNVHRIVLNDDRLYQYLPDDIKAKYEAARQYPMKADVDACQRVYPDARIEVFALAGAVKKHGWIGHDVERLGYHLEHPEKATILLPDPVKIYT